MGLDLTIIAIFVAFFAGTWAVARKIKEDLSKFNASTLNCLKKIKVKNGNDVVSIHKTITDSENYIDSKNEKIAFSFWSGILFIVGAILSYVEGTQLTIGGLKQLSDTILILSFPVYCIFTTPLIYDYVNDKIRKISP